MRLPRRRPRPDGAALSRFLHGNADDQTVPFTRPDPGRYQSAPAGPAPPRRTHQAAGRGWIMTVNTDTPGGPMNAGVQAARQFLELEVADYAKQGMLYRIDDAEQVRQRGEALDERSVIAVTVQKAVRHLMGPREPWDPAGWDHGLAWHHPGDTDPPEPWRAAYDRHLGGAA